MLIAAALTNFMAVLSCEGSGISEHESAYVTTSLRNAATSASNGEYKVMDSETIAEVIGPERQKCFMGKCTYSIAKELQARYGVSCSINKVGKDILTSIEVYSSNGDYIVGYQPATGNIINIAKDIAENFPSVLFDKMKKYSAKPESKLEPKPETKAEVKPQEPKVEPKPQEPQIKTNGVELSGYCGMTFKEYILAKKIIPTFTIASPTPFFEIESRKQQYGSYSCNYVEHCVSGRSALKFQKQVTKDSSGRNISVWEIFYGDNLNIRNGKEINIDLNDQIMGHKIHKIETIVGTDGVETYKELACDLDSNDPSILNKKIARRVVEAAAEKAAAEKAAAERAAAEKAAAEKAAEEAAAAQRALAAQRAIDERIAQRAAAERAAQREAEEMAAAAERLARKDAVNIYGGWCGDTPESFIKSWGRRPDYTGIGFYRYDDIVYNVEVHMGLRGNISEIHLRSKSNDKVFFIKACS